MRIATVCGMGLGTSMLLATQVRGLLGREGIEARVDPVDLGSLRTVSADLVVAPRDMEPHVSGTGATVVLLDNLLDRDEIAEKVLRAVREPPPDGG